LERAHSGIGIPDFPDLDMGFWNILPSVADLPATVVPVGFTATHGLPCGVQIVAGNFQDLTSIEVGRMLEQCNPLTRYVPPPGFHAPPDAKL